jgi:hypothetical protein
MEVYKVTLIDNENTDWSTENVLAEDLDEALMKAKDYCGKLVQDIRIEENKTKAKKSERLSKDFFLIPNEIVHVCSINIE